MKNRSCPNKDACWDYDASNCEGCAIGEKIARLVRQNKKLKAENTALRERFATLNKMPCNIGDTVYVLFGSCYRCEDYEGDHCSCEKMGKDKIFEMKVGSVRFDKDDYYLYEDPIGISSGLSCSGRNYGKTWFLSMEEAKEYLEDYRVYDTIVTDKRTKTETKQ